MKWTIKKKPWHLIQKYVSIQVRSLVSLAQASEEEILAAVKVSQVLWDGAWKYDSISTVATFFLKLTRSWSPQVDAEKVENGTMGLTPVATPSRSEINPPVVHGSQPAEEVPETLVEPAEVPETSPEQSVNAAQDAAKKPVLDLVVPAAKEIGTSEAEQSRKALGMFCNVLCARTCSIGNAKHDSIFQMILP